MSDLEIIQQFRPATDELIRHLAGTVRDVRQHQHQKHEDIYCLNLVAFMGERMGSVLRRLADAEAEIERLRNTAKARVLAEAGDPRVHSALHAKLVEQATPTGRCGEAVPQAGYDAPAGGDLR